ncbi:hypothetical protein HYX16_06605 [Candidatus Woesearchaeota archaeon]|nr:hypothetical protein [Candidatus Woesearchaeota archaeon]
MIFFKKKDPVCRMKQTDGGIEKHGYWFCSNNCLDIYEKGLKKIAKTKHGCCS